MTIDKVLLGKILAFSEAGYTQTKISEKTGVSQSAVSRCLKRCQEHGPITHRVGNGRPSVVSEAIKSAILRQNKANSRFSLRKHVAKLAKEHGTTLGHDTSSKGSYEQRYLCLFSGQKTYINGQAHKK